MDIQAIETKLAAARTKLILDKPFIGALVLRLPLVAAKKEWCPTTGTDARSFFYNPEYIDSLNLSQTQFMLAHEALHCALSHFARRGHRVKHRWDLACDFAINPLLLEDGLAPPPDAAILDHFLGMTAEEIYPLLEDNDLTETLDQHLYDDSGESGRDSGGNTATSPPPPSGQQEHGKGHEPGNRSGAGSGTNSTEAGNGQNDGARDDSHAERPAPLTPDERDTLAVQWQQRMAGAAQQAMQAGKLGGTLGRLIDHLLQPQLPWRTLLARFLSGLARDDFSYMRPSRREGEAIQPSLRSAQVDLAVAVDTSGSVKREEISEFIAEIDAIKGQIRARITLLPCDASLADGAPWSYEPWESFAIPEQLPGGGGTDFRPVFEWLETRDSRPDLLVYFTDAEGNFPEHPPGYPVLWLVKGRKQVPWGDRVQLN